MKFKKYLTEAIGIETVKKALVGHPIWDYKNEFKDIFGDKYRIIIGTIEPDESFLNEHPLYNQLEKIFVDAGYILTRESYIKGYVTKGKQQFKIGRLLQKWGGTDIVGGKNYLESFRDDPLRQANRKPYMVVVSKHPYDVLGASTDRNWTSCLNLGGGIIYSGNNNDKGMNADILIDSLHAPFLVAYLVDPDDKNSQGKVMIQRPLGRILIYPFKHESGEFYNWSVGEIYGINDNRFSGIVKNWIEKLNSKFKPDNDDDTIFNMIPDVFYDSYDQDLVRTFHDPEVLFDRTAQQLKNIDLGNLMLHYKNGDQYYVIYDLLLKGFIDREYMNNPLVGDENFFNDYFLMVVNKLFLNTPIVLIYPSIDDFEIYRIWGSGDIVLQPVKLNDNNEAMVNDMTDVDELIYKYGPHYNIRLILDKIKQFDRGFSDYKNMVSNNLKVFFEELPKKVGDALVENGIDPDISNWRELNYDTMYEIVDELMKYFRME